MILRIGASVVIALMATSVDWVGALLIGVGGEAAGFASGKVAGKLYSASGSKLDIASKTGVTGMCPILASIVNRFSLSKMRS